MPENSLPPNAIAEALNKVLDGPHVRDQAGAILATLGFAVFLRTSAGALQLASDPPGWLRHLWPALTAPGDELAAVDLTPFLENFLIDAHECWAQGSSQPIRSGPWVEAPADEEELNLEASAFAHAGQPVLIVERLGATFDTRRELLQKGRETAIAYQRLNSETQKKEILLHCLAYEMSAALNNVVTSLRLLELEPQSPNVRRMVEYAQQATFEQQRLMHRILGVFVAELEGLYGRRRTATGGIDVMTAVHRAIETVGPQYAGQGVRLNALPPVGDLKVVDNASRLERVLVNLLENALEYTPSGGHVAVRIEGYPDAIMLRVEDDSPVLSQDFSLVLSGKSGLPATAARLHFCRITVENNLGEIGHAPRGGGGNCYWVRWPKAN